MKQRSWTVIAWLFAGALVVSMSLIKISSADVWWHLKTGEYIMTHHTVPTHDIFSYTALGQPWVTHEWLFEILLFLAFKLGALIGINLLNAAIVLLGFVFMFLTLRRLKIESFIAVPMVILAAFLVTFRAYARPHIVTECLLALYLLVLLTWKYVPEFRTNRNRLWWLLAVQLVWANTHSGGILGIGLFAGFIVCEFIQGRLARLVGWIARDALPNRELGFLLKLTAGLLLVSLINPNLHRALLYPVTFAGDPIFLDMIQELQSPLSSNYMATDFLRAYLILLGIGAISFAVTIKRLELSHLVIFCVLALTSLNAVRNLPILAVIAVPLVAINLQSLLHRTGGARRKTSAGWRPGAGVASFVIVLLPVALLFVVFTRGVRAPNRYRKPAFGYEARLFPTRAADFLARQPVQGNIFSTLEYNGYFIWRWFPEHKVFIDGRLDVFGPDLFRQYGRIISSPAAADSAFRRYNINCCVLPQPPANSPAAQQYLGRALAFRPDWTLVYWDDLALVFLRNTPAHESLIAQYAYRSVTPVLFGQGDTGVANEQVLAEIERAVRESPESPYALTLLGVTHARLSQFEAARAAIDRALKLSPAYTGALLALASTHRQEGNYPAAIATLERALRLEPKNDVVLYNLGVNYFQNDRLDQAEKLLRQTLGLNPDAVPAWIQLGDVYRRQGRTEQAAAMWQAALKIDRQNPDARSRLDSLRTPSR